MTVRFTSDGSVTYKGFYASYYGGTYNQTGKYTHTRGEVQAPYSLYTLKGKTKYICIYKLVECLLISKHLIKPE